MSLLNGCVCVYAGKSLHWWVNLIVSKFREIHISLCNILLKICHEYFSKVACYVFLILLKSDMFFLWALKQQTTIHFHIPNEPLYPLLYLNLQSNFDQVQIFVYIAYLFLIKKNMNFNVTMRNLHVSTCLVLSGYHHLTLNDFL